MKSIIKSIILLSIILCATSYTQAESVNMEDITITGIGNSNVSQIVIGNLTDGLSGYNITISINDSSKVSISSISFPSWAILHSHSNLSSDSVRLKAADLNNQIESGTSNVILASITITSLDFGTTILDLTSIRIDDDDGYPIETETTDSFVTVENEQSQNDESGNSGDYPPSNDKHQINNETNEYPIAITEVSYNGNVDDLLYFNGGKSYDPDGGNITSWIWDFGDGLVKTGKIQLHKYNESGVFSGSLTVIDDENTTGVMGFSVNITEKNYPPANLIFEGIRLGTCNKTYLFNISSIDRNNDSIQYIIYWGDGTYPNVSSFLPSGITFTTTHQWKKPGRYHVNITASDNKSNTINTTFIYIDATAISDIGFIVDSDKDGYYDIFYHNYGNSSTVNHVDNEYYIDINNDSIWDFVYSKTNGLNQYGAKEETGFNWFVPIIIIFLFLLFGSLFYLLFLKK